MTTSPLRDICLRSGQADQDALGWRVRRFRCDGLETIGKGKGGGAGTATHTGWSFSGPSFTEKGVAHATRETGVDQG